MSDSRMLFVHESAGVISEGRIWVVLHGGYLYTAETLDELLRVIYSEWEHDRWLVG